MISLLKNFKFSNEHIEYLKFALFDLFIVGAK